MSEDHISDLWLLFKEYTDKKQLSILAERYIDLLADYGVQDDILIASLGHDSTLDGAIKYYLDLDNVEDDEDDEDY